MGGLGAGALEQERQQLVRELEDMQREHGRTGDAHDVGQSKHLMDMAAMELSKLKVSPTLFLGLTLSCPSSRSRVVPSCTCCAAAPPWRLLHVAVAEMKQLLPAV